MLRSEETEVNLINGINSLQRAQEDFTRKYNLFLMDYARFAYCLSTLINQDLIPKEIIFGFNVNLINHKSGTTPLTLACHVQSEELAFMLLFWGANPNLQDRMGNLPINVAASKNNNMILYLLLEYGANINKKDFNGNTPLHISSHYEKLKNAEILLNQGASIGEYNKNLQNPIAIAIFRGNLEMINLFLKYKPLKEDLDFITIFTTQLSEKYDLNCINLITEYHNKCEGEEKDVAQIFQYIKDKSESYDDKTHPSSQKYEYALGIGLGIFVINPTIRSIRDWLNGENKNKHISEYYTEVFKLDAITSVATSAAISITNKILASYFCIPDNILGQNNYIAKAMPQFDSSILNGIVASSIFEIAMLGLDATKASYCELYDCS